MTKAEFMEMMDRVKEQTVSDIVKALREAEYRGYMKAVTNRPRGEWVNVKISILGDSSAECSLCNAVVHNNFSNAINFCPNCGADMRKGVDDGSL